ncbi:hypothetical protein Sango_2434200 [Sesamum angolense]|uniref:Reverse transcriptase RNase H-like domain-containing protein n=1 Tax=Sesamum angolense TaxID=2727404 RepID=A0AAE1W7N7_9LAMI|nr:hypothetical protein Sango_2434200 [Sesamum angolense]
MLNGAKGRYTPIEKVAFALVVTARRLRPNFLSHSVGVKTNLPLKQTLEKPDTSGLMVKWAVELRARHLAAYLDSQLVVKQVEVMYEAK